MKKYKYLYISATIYVLIENLVTKLVSFTTTSSYSRCYKAIFSWINKKSLFARILKKICRQAYFFYRVNIISSEAKIAAEQGKINLVSFPRFNNDLFERDL